MRGEPVLARAKTKTQFPQPSQTKPPPTAPPPIPTAPLPTGNRDYLSDGESDAGRGVGCEIAMVHFWTRGERIIHPAPSGRCVLQNTAGTDFVMGRQLTYFTGM